MAKRVDDHTQLRVSIGVPDPPERKMTIKLNMTRTKKYIPLLSGNVTTVFVSTSIHKRHLHFRTWYILRIYVHGRYVNYMWTMFYNRGQHVSCIAV